MGVRRSVNLPEFYPIPRDKPAANVMSALASRLILHLVQRRLLWVKAQVDFLLFEGKSGFFFMASSISTMRFGTTSCSKRLQTDFLRGLILVVKRERERGGK